MFAVGFHGRRQRQQLGFRHSHIPARLPRRIRQREVRDRFSASDGSFWGVILGLLQAIVWPVYLVYNALVLMGA